MLFFVCSHLWVCRYTSHATETPLAVVFDVEVDAELGDSGDVVAHLRRSNTPLCRYLCGVGLEHYIHTSRETTIADKSLVLKVVRCAIQTRVWIRGIFECVTADVERGCIYPLGLAECYGYR